MPKLIKLPQFKDSRGDLTVLENELDFPIKRLFFIANVPSNEIRGGHGHFKNRQFLLCVNGSCKVDVVKKDYKQSFLLNSSNVGILIEPEDWHTMSEFDSHTVLLVAASHAYDPNDYFTTPEA